MGYLVEDYKLSSGRKFVASAGDSFYNLHMARGWESKSVESQMESAKDGNAVAGPQPTDKEKQSQRERQRLLLSRTYVLHQIEASSNERYTQSLRQALNDLDQKIAKLDGR
jgi:hypothetical protein